MTTTAPEIAADVQLEGHAVGDSPGTDENMTNAGDSVDTSTNHLQTGATEKDENQHPPSWAQRQAKADEEVSQSSKTGNRTDGKSDKEIPKETATATAPVSLFALYRFHRPHEIAINALGLICAFVSGTAQVSSSTYSSHIQFFNLFNSH
jgi:hypothetical protein